MLLMEFSSLSRRISTLKYPIRSSCLSKHVRYNVTARFIKDYPENFRTRPLLTSTFHPGNTHLCTSSVFKRCKHNASQSKSNEETQEKAEEQPEKLSLFKRYHKMLKEYWYVLIPVHMVTSAFWFGGFYYAAKSGLDIIPFLEYINVPESLIKPLRNSSLGHIAVASALYKLATPARYMVTLGGTTFAVKFLTKRGLIRPAPTKAELKTIIQNKLKKDSIPEKDK